MKNFRWLILIVLIGGLLSCNKGGKISSIIISPETAVIAVGQSQRFLATAIFTDGTSVSWTNAVRWDTSNGTEVTIGNTVGYYGLASSVTGTGDYVISATDQANGLVGYATLYVREPALSVTPANAYLPLAVSHQYTATGSVWTSATGTITVDLTSSATWTASNEAVASVTASSGVVTASTVTTGTTFVTASYLNSTGTTTVQVISEALTALTIAGNATMPAATTQNFTATGTFPGVFPNPASRDYTSSVTWASSDTTVATISADGLVSATTKTGTTSISATDPISGQTSNSVTVTVQ